jgi:hypothetical protein
MYLTVVFIVVLHTLQANASTVGYTVKQATDVHSHSECHLMLNNPCS